MGPAPSPNVLPTAGCVGPPFTCIQPQGLRALSPCATARNKNSTPRWCAPLTSCSPKRI
ncbi:hypothetical protein T484DRAFT_1974919 [Baffinella frigidus]|nr:hypothetical protein T484DRAFT_1974919 [Cryptophyta sp. CCMP2293]